MGSRERWIVLLVLVFGALVGGVVGDVIRNLAALFLVPLIAIQLYGSLSRPVLLALMRLCIAAPFGLATWVVLYRGHEPLVAVLFALSGLTFGLAPYLGARARKAIYIGWLVLMAAAIVGSQLAYPDGTAFVMFSGVGWITAVCFFARWTMSLSSPLDWTAIMLRDECRKVLNWLNQPPNGRPWWKADERKKFVTELEGFFSVAQNSDSRRVLREVCTQYEGTALAWQVAYASAISVGDYEEAVTLMRKGHMAGHEHELGNLPLAYAMAKIGDPGWQRTLARARINGEFTPGTYDDLRDPFVKWRKDSHFGRFESALMPSSEFMPPRMIPPPFRV